MMNTFGRWVRSTTVLAICGELLIGRCAIAQQKAETEVQTDATADETDATRSAASPNAAGSRPAYRPSRDAAAVVEITNSGELRYFNADSGRRLSSCRLCSAELEEKYGPKCERALKTRTPICQGTADATIFNLEQVAMTRSRVNPFCMVFYSAGRMVQGPCICKTGEAVPPGIVCAKWIP